MDAIAAEVATLTEDARRAARAGAIGDSPGHPGSVVIQPLDNVIVRTTPSPSPLSVSIDGAGFFIVERDGHRSYSRLGDFRFDSSGTLVDGRGRRVLGFAANSADSADAPAPIQRHQPKAPSIDANGVVSVDGAHGRETVGKLALAIFPAPEHLARADETSAHETAESGAARLVKPGMPNVGRLEPHSLENALVDVAGDLDAMWRAQRRGESASAAAAADDSCERAALGLVR